MRRQPYAFMFDADHKILGPSFGPPCTRRVVEALESLDDETIATQIHKGSLLPHMEAYRITSVSSSTEARFSEVSISKSPDYDLYSLVVCELADSLCEQPNTLNQETFLVDLAKKEIWTISLTTITEKQALLIDAQLREFAPYLGMAQIDVGNPLQFRQFSLVDGMYFSNGRLNFRTPAYGDQEDIDEAKSIASMYTDNDPLPTAEEKFDELAPPGLIAAPLSSRGRLTEARLTGRSSPTHRQRVAQEIIDQFREGALPDFEFRVDEIESREFLCEETKVRDYLLNPDHQKGASKARFFMDTLGIERSDWRYLADQIERAMRSASLFRTGKTPFGVTHRSAITVCGRNGREAVLITGWEIKDTGAARLLTAYPGDKELERSPAPESAVVDPKLVGDERWNAIYQVAHRLGVEAAGQKIPTPMVLKGYAPIFAGACGFAWVKLPDARTKFSRWLSRNRIGSRGYPGGYSISPRLTQADLPYADLQSLEPKAAYCEAFAEVLRKNGVHCVVESRLD